MIRYVVLSGGENHARDETRGDVKKINCLWIGFLVYGTPCCVVNLILVRGAPAPTTPEATPAPVGRAALS